MTRTANILIFLMITWLSVGTVVRAETTIDASDSAPLPAADKTATSNSRIQQATLDGLESSIELQNNVRRQLDGLRKALKNEKSETVQQELKGRISRLEGELASAEEDFEYLAAGANLSTIREVTEAEFNFQKELFALVKPAITEIKDMTSDVRRKSELREAIDNYSQRLNVSDRAITQLENAMEDTENKALLQALGTTRSNWEQQASLIRNKLQTTQLQLDKLRAAETSVADVSTSYLKDFFQKRGLYLAQAVLAMASVFLLSSLIRRAFHKLIPDYTSEQRSFRIRLLDLALRFVTILLAVLAPILVFYFVEDWMLLSLSILFVIGLGWTLSKTLPRYYKEIELFLNLGSVREGERIIYNGLPWRVKTINIFSILENPDAGLKQRIRLSDLVEQTSRPLKADEPWFPCHKDDWVVLSDGTVGKVFGISQEMMELIELGGSRKTYSTADFIAQAPRNISTNFRLKEVIGISYELQKESVEEIPRLLEAHIRHQMAEEGFLGKLKNLRVEFELANTSSLDIAVIADWSGELANQYTRMRRAMQRWCVSACNEYGWEIPFQQITLHQAG